MLPCYTEMMSKESRFNVYLRSFRRRANLRQHEVALLLGQVSGTTVSRHERVRRLPRLTTLFAYQIIFGVCSYDSYRGLFREIEVATKERMRLLVRRIERANPDGRRRHALRLLNEAIEKPYILITRKAVGTFTISDR